MAAHLADARHRAQPCGERQYRAEDRGTRAWAQPCPNPRGLPRHRVVRAISPDRTAGGSVVTRSGWTIAWHEKPEHAPVRHEPQTLNTQTNGIPGRLLRVINANRAGIAAIRSP